MDVLFLNHNYRNQGTYYRAMPMAEQLAGRGHRVTLMTVSPRHRWRTHGAKLNGVEVIETPGWGQNNSGGGYGPLDNGSRLLHALSHHYDIIHMFDHKPNATLAGFAGRLRGARLVADWADQWGGAGGVNDVPSRRIPAIGRFEGWWEEKSKLWADGVVTISTVLQQRALDIGCVPDRTLYLPTGAALERISPVPLDEARHALDIPTDRQIAGFIGTIPGEIEAILRMLQDIPDLWLMVIGRKNSRLLDMADSMRVANRLWSTGFVPDNEVGRYLACANFMVLPLADSSANQGRLPNKLLDYLAAGRPVLASPVGDVGMIMQTHEIGLEITDLDFVNAARRFMSDSKLAEKLGRSARQLAETTFNWSSLIVALEDFYGRLRGLDERQRQPRSSTCT